MKNILLVLCLTIPIIVLADPCPNNNGSHWSIGTTVYYSLGSWSDFQKQQIRAAFDEWNNETYHMMGSDSVISFKEDDGQHPVVWTWVNGIIDNKPNAGAGTLIPKDGTGDIQSTATTINFLAWPPMAHISTLRGK